MTHLLPPNTLRLFQPRPQLPYLRPTKRDIDPRQLPKKTIRPLDGIAGVLERVKQESADKGEATDETEAAIEAKNEWVVNNNGTHVQRSSRHDQKDSRTRQLRQFNPKDDPEAIGDPFTTLFVSRLDYTITEEELRNVFEMYGPIKRIRIVCDKKTGKSRGYAFILYENERDMRAAYKETEGIILKGNLRAMVDVERGRTVKDWKPMRLGGGLGGISRKKKEPPPPPVAASSASNSRSSFGGGRSSHGGGFRGSSSRYANYSRGGGGAPAAPYAYSASYSSNRYDGGPPPAKRGRY